MRGGLGRLGRRTSRAHPACPGPADWRTETETAGPDVLAFEQLAYAAVAHAYR